MKFEIIDDVNKTVEEKHFTTINELAAWLHTNASRAPKVAFTPNPEGGPMTYVGEITYAL